MSIFGGSPVLSEENIEKLAASIRQHQYANDEFHARVGRIGEARRASSMSVRVGEGDEAQFMDGLFIDKDNPFGLLPEPLRVPEGHEHVPSDVVLSSFAAVARGVLGEALRLGLTVAMEHEPDEEATLRRLLTSSDMEDVNEMMGYVARSTGVLTFQPCGDHHHIRLARVEDVISDMDRMEVVSIDVTTGERQTRSINLAEDEEGFRELMESGFDPNMAAMTHVLAETPDTPVLVHWGGARIDPQSWQYSVMHGEFNPRILTALVAHRVHGYLLTAFAVELGADGEPHLRLVNAVHETVEEHATPGHGLIAADPFGTGPNGDTYQAVRIPRPTNPRANGTAAMLRALADVLDGKSNRIPTVWDEKFDDQDDNDLPPVGRKVKA